MPGQPFLSRLAIGGEVSELGVVAGAVEDPDVAELRAFDHLECEPAVERERPVDTDRDDAIGAEIALMQRKIRRQVDVADATLALLADQSTLAVTVFPSGKLLPVAFGRARRAVGPGDNGADRSAFVNQKRKHALSPVGLWMLKKAAAGDGRRRYRSV